MARGRGRAPGEEQECVFVRAAAEAECEGRGVCAGAEGSAWAVRRVAGGRDCGGGVFGWDGLERGEDVVLEVGGVEVICDSPSPVDGEELAGCVAGRVGDDDGRVEQGRLEEHGAELGDVSVDVDAVELADDAANCTVLRRLLLLLAGTLVKECLLFKLFA